MTTAERWQQVKRVLGHALELEPSWRSAYLEQASVGDPELRAEVERLLEAEERAGREFLGTIAAQALADDVAAAATNSRVGQRVGPYRIVEPIGQGGMGTVYRAVRADDQYQKQVAIKLIQAGGNSAFIIARFKNERQILASLDHPNIAHLLDGGATEDRTPYFVMELIEGQPIDKYCNRKRLSVNERLSLFLQVCSAVQFAHQRLIIHRDIKPGNILVGSDGVPKLLDFGIAKILDPAVLEARDPTLSVFRPLTPAYASPEQIKGQSVTTASDVYSLGVLLYELLTGRHPYRISSQSPRDIERAVCEVEPERPSAALWRMETREPAASRGTALFMIDVRDGSPERVGHRLRGDLDNILLMALRKEPQLRYVSVEQFATDIRRHLENLPVNASTGTVKYRTAKFIRRHKAGVAATTVVAAALFIGLAATLHEARVARKQAAIAQAERIRAQRRFDDVHKLANSLIFEVHDSIVNLPGATSARKLIMDRALQYLDSLASDAHGDSSLERDLAKAYQRIGMVQGDPNQGNIGQTDAMLLSYAKAAQLYEHVAQANPTSAGDQLHAAVAHRLLTTVCRDATERRRHIELALAITHRFLNNNFSSEVANERAIELSVLAAIQHRDGDLPGALDTRHQDIEIREAILARDPNFPHARDALAESKSQAAYDLALLGRTQEALHVNSEAVQLYESVVAQNKNDARAARELEWIKFFDRGDFLFMEGKVADALTNFRRSLAGVEIRQKQDPGNVLLQIYTGEAAKGVGSALISSGKASASVAMLDRSIAILQSQMRIDLGEMAVALSATYVWKADALAMLGKTAAAVANDRKALSVLEMGLQGSSPDQFQLCAIAATNVRLGSVLARAGNVKDADLAYHRALDLVARDAADAPNVGIDYVLADAYFGLGELLRMAGERKGLNSMTQISNLRQAREWYQKSEKIWSRIPNPAFVNPEGFQCGSPSRLVAAHAALERDLKRVPL
jgi:eukaryotic-like serine/threonine-protein kinase